jgi:hypothetical protein
LRRQVPVILTTITALVVFLGLILFKLDQLQVVSKIDRMRQFMTAVMMFIGMVNLFRVHGAAIRRRDRTWVFSVWLLAVMVLYAAFGMAVGNKNQTYRWLYDALVVPINGTMFALVAFYITSASFKAFRAKTAEAALMMVCAVWVMIANVPIGDFLWPSTGWLGGMAGIGSWIVSVPNSAVSRAVGVGIFLGGFATNLRVFLGIERRHLGSV